MNVPLLVAHRGYAREYPENTIESIAAAAAAGACYVEFDIQLSADHVPVLLHDSDLERTTGHRGQVFDLPLAQLHELHADETGRLGERYHGTRIPSLDELVERLGDWPALNVFIEIKEESLDRFGLEAVMDTVMPRLAPCIERCTLISFAAEVVAAARARGAQRAGWVVRKWSAAALQWIETEQPDVVFCNYRKIPDDYSLHNPDRAWALYEIDTPELALHWADRGAAMIETFDIGSMLQDPRLAQRRCRHD